MTHASQIRTLLISALLVAIPALAAPPSELPIGYTMERMVGGEQDDYVNDFHLTTQRSLAHYRKANERTLYELAESGPVEWADVNAWFASPRTDGALARYEEDHANMLDNPAYLFLVRQPLQAFEPGASYREPPYTWRAENLEVDFSRGEQDQKIAGVETEHYVATIAFDYTTAYHEETNRFELRRDMWFAPSLPYTRLAHRQPFIDASHDTLSWTRGRLEDGIIARLEPRMRKAGLLLKTSFERDGETIVATARNLRSAPALDTRPVAKTPLLESRAQYMALLEPLFGNRFLDENGPVDGESSVKLPAVAGHDALRASGKAGFQVHENGDLGLALTFEADNGDSGYLMLVRPHHGLPRTGEYPVTDKRDDSALEKLSAAELKSHAENFQIVGLIEGEDRITAFLGENADGRITINESSDQRLAGEISLDLEALAAAADGQVATTQITGCFEAVPTPGLMTNPTDTSELLADAQ